MNFETVLDLFFPHKCSICGMIGECICDKCIKDLEKYKFKKAKRDLNLNKEFLEVEKTYIFEYKEIIRKLLINYKFNDESNLAYSFAKIISKDKNLCRFLEKYDIIIPVPLSKKRYLERGYNQSELVLRKLKKYLPNLMIEKNSLVKIKNIKPQSTLNRNERIKNVKNVYNLQNVEKIYNKNLLIFDDICTTGSTANECIKMLKPIAKNIGFMAIAKD